MSVEDRGKKEFEFIKEQVLQKKRKKIRKILVPFFMTLFMAILFGVVAAVTFCLTEPRLYKLLHREEEAKPQITFPTTYPGGEGEDGDKTVPTPSSKAGDPDGEDKPVDGQAPEVKNEPGQVIVQAIEANIDDFLSMSDEIRTVAYRANKSLVTISSIIKGKDWLGYPTETVIQTSGLIIYNNGKELGILVSYDRVVNASSIRMKLTESESVEAELQDYEKEVNLAIVTVNIANIPELFMNNSVVVATLGESYTITVGSPIIALGNPNGYPNSMDPGYVTSRGSSISITDNKLDLFNTDIVDNANSDGIIINLKGEVIGLITRKLKVGLNENLNTVIGISKIKPIIERLANKQPRIYCGVVAEDLTEAAKKEHEVANGIYIREVRANSPAFTAGLRGGDIILMVDEKNIMNTNSFYSIVSDYQPDSVVTLKIKRTSGTAKEMEMKVTLREKERN